MVFSGVNRVLPEGFISAPRSAAAEFVYDHTLLRPGDVQSVFEQIAFKRVLSVVQIQLIQRDQRPFGPEQLENFFLPDGEGQRSKNIFDERKIGAGVIVRSNGYIVTTRHLLKNADEVHVILKDGSRLVADVIGTDAESDIAVLKVDAEHLPVMPADTVSALRAGQWVMSIGSPLSSDFYNSVTLGVVSATGMQADTPLLLTDAPLNHGNSGGPLVGAKGEMVGLASVPYSATSGFTGLGHMIPASRVMRVANSLIEQGMRGQPHLGVEFGPVAVLGSRRTDMQTGAARIVHVKPGSAAEQAGLRQGDVVLAVNDNLLDNHLELSENIAARAPGDVITLTINRQGDAFQMEVKLADLEQLMTDDPIDEDPQEVLMRDMGFTIDNVTQELVRDLAVPVNEGVVVLYVNPNSKSYREGDLRGGMIIVEMADQKIRNREDFLRVYSEIPSDVYFLVMVHRPQTRGALLTALSKP